MMWEWREIEKAEIRVVGCVGLEYNINEKSSQESKHVVMFAS